MDSGIVYSVVLLKTNLKYGESHGKIVLTAVKNWHKIRREEDYPKRVWYGEKDI